VRRAAVDQLRSQQEQHQQLGDTLSACRRRRCGTASDALPIVLKKLAADFVEI